ncbi:MAG: NAD-dependent epimerase/dehydratase family protein [Phycisphaerae bacterium]|jgi:nucleoside-diphosphate-sugar epimerase
MPTILITGASGFVGGAAAQCFRESGWNVLETGRRHLNREHYVRQDLSKPFSDEFLQQIDTADVILHAAARSSPWGTRAQFLADNVQSTERLLNACVERRRTDLPRFFFVSSSSVYYRSEDQFQITETTPHAVPAVNLYADTKQRCEKLVRGYPGSWIIFRPRAVYGPGDTVLFPRILEAARAGRLPLLVRPNTPVVGDLISIENLVHCFRIAAENPELRGDFNLTDGQPVEIVAFLLSVFERLQIPKPTRRVTVHHAFRIAWLIEMAYGAFAWWKEPPITRFGVHVFAWSKTFDVTKMLTTFGQPRVTTSEGIDHFVDWMRKESQHP